MAGKSSKGGGFSSKSSGGGFSKGSSSGSSYKSSSPSSPSSQRSSGGSSFGSLFSGSGSKSPARKIGGKDPKGGGGGGGFGSWRAPNTGTIFGRSFGQSPTGGRRGCMGCGCVVAIATLISSLGGLAAVLMVLG